MIGEQGETLSVVITGSDSGRFATGFAAGDSEADFGAGRVLLVQPSPDRYVLGRETPEGGLTFEDGISEAGRYVEMRAEMDVIILISNCPQLNNPCNAYNPTPARMLVWDGQHDLVATPAPLDARRRARCPSSGSPGPVCPSSFADPC